MRQHHALGLRRRSARVNDGQQIAGLDSGRRCRWIDLAVRPGRGAGGEPVGPAVDPIGRRIDFRIHQDDAREWQGRLPRFAVPQRLDPLGGSRGLRERQRRSAVFEDQSEFSVRRVDAPGYVDRAHVRAPQVRDEPLVAVLGDDRYAVAVTDPGFQQGRRAIERVAREFAVGRGASALRVAPFGEDPVAEDRFQLVDESGESGPRVQLHGVLT